jgi:hypothetical protein
MFSRSLIYSVAQRNGAENDTKDRETQENNECAAETKANSQQAHNPTLYIHFSHAISLSIKTHRHPSSCAQIAFLTRPNETKTACASAADYISLGEFLSA